MTKKTKAAPPSLLEAAKSARRHLEVFRSEVFFNAKGYVKERANQTRVLAALNDAIAAHEAAPPSMLEAAQIVNKRIAFFDKDCSENGYTDTGDAWALLHGIKDTLNHAIGVCEAAQKNAEWSPMCAYCLNPQTEGHQDDCDRPRKRKA